MVKMRFLSASHRVASTPGPPNTEEFPVATRFLVKLECCRATPYRTTQLATVAVVDILTSEIQKAVRERGRTKPSDKV